MLTNYDKSVNRFFFFLLFLFSFGSFVICCLVDFFFWVLSHADNTPGRVKQVTYAIKIGLILGFKTIVSY